MNDISERIFSFSLLLTQPVENVEALAFTIDDKPVEARIDVYNPGKDNILTVNLPKDSPLILLESNFDRTLNRRAALTSTRDNTSINWCGSLTF